MNWWGPWLFLLLLSFLSYIIVGIFGGLWLWHVRNVNGKSEIVGRLAMVLFALSFSGVMQFAAAAFGYKIKPVPTIGFAVCYWIGVAGLCISIWRFLISVVKGKSHDKEIDTSEGK